MALVRLTDRDKDVIAPEMRTEYLIKKFHKMIEKEGLMEELKQRMYFKSKSSQRREKAQKARLRAKYRK